MRTENEDHQVPEPHETRRLRCAMGKARLATLRVCGEDVAVFCLLDALG